MHSFVTNGANIFSATDSGVFLSSDNGTSWHKRTTGLPSYSVELIGVNGTTLFADDSGVFRSTDNGTNWVAANTELAVTGITAFASSGFNFYVATWKGVLRTSDGGLTWINASNGLPDSTEIFSLAVRGDKIFAGTIHGEVFLSVDLGASWSNVSTRLTHSSIVALTSSKDYVFAGSYTQGVWRRPVLEFGINKVKGEISTRSDIQLSPNPTTSIITIHNAPENLTSATIMNVLGEKVLELANPYTSDFMIDLSKLVRGMYYARFIVGSSVEVKKIIKE